MSTVLEVLPDPDPTEGKLERQIATLEARKAKLQKLHLLQCEVNELELGMLRAHYPAAVAFAEITAVVSSHFGIAIQALRSPLRTGEVAFARMVALYLSRRLTDMPMRVIGEFFGKRCHGSVMHAVVSVENRRDTDPGFAEALLELTRRCQGQLAKLKPTTL
jgi:chromosomal replication initiation ATPase DnaA